MNILKIWFIDVQLLIDKIFRNKDKKDFELISNPNKSNNSKDYHAIKENEYEK